MNVVAQEFSVLSSLPGSEINAELERAKLARINQGLGIFDLSMLNPDIHPPRYLLDRLVEATMKPQNHRYAVSRGIRKLRHAFADKYATRFGVSLDPETEICVTLGAKEGLLSVLRCLAEPQDKILLPAPTYPTFLAAALITGLVPDYYNVISDEASMLAELEKKLKSSEYKILILNFPNNPTGISVSKSFLEAVLRIAADMGTYVVNDFVYGEMSFSGQPAPASVLSLAEQRSLDSGVVEIYSMSKAYSVPGWRVAAVLGNKVIIKSLVKLKSYTDYGIFLPIQMAAASALSADEQLVQPIVNDYERRAKVLCDGLSRLGWKLDMPAAGVSVWASLPLAKIQQATGVNGVDSSSKNTYLKNLFDKTGILAKPGETFGESYKNSCRFSLGLSSSGIHEVLSRLESFSQDSNNLIAA